MKLAKRDCKKYILLLLLLATVVLVVNSSVVLAKYTSERKHESEISDIVEFHFTSDIAKVGGVTYPWHNGIYENGVVIELYNYNKDNVALVSEMDITYTVTAADCTVVCYASDGITQVKPSGDGVYTIAAIADGDGGYLGNSQTLYITPNETLPKENIEVDITSTSPFATTLSATFQVDTDNRDPIYTVADKTDKTDRGEYILVTVYTNAYLGDLNVAWSDGVAPDNTDPLMREWINTNEATIDAKQFSTYEMIFFKLDDTYTITVTRGAE